jgi:hypothetical protein
LLHSRCTFPGSAIGLTNQLQRAIESLSRDPWKTLFDSTLLGGSDLEDSFSVEFDQCPRKTAAHAAGAVVNDSIRATTHDPLFA